MVILRRELKYAQIESELSRMMPSDDEEDEDDEEFTFVSERPNLFNNLDAKMNKIQSYSYKELLDILDDCNQSAQSLSPAQPSTPVQAPSPVQEFTIRSSPERNVSEKDAVDEPMSSFSLESNVPVEAAVNEPMLPSALEEDIRSEPVAEEPRPPPIPTPAYQCRGPSDPQRFRSSSNYFDILKKSRECLPLLEILYSEKIYAVGTIRANRKGLPPEISKQNKDLKLSPGEFIFKFACVKWMDTKDVLVSTTAHDPRSVEVKQRTQKNGSKKQCFVQLL
ncbi:unnamed protein product [Parnassius apollo]|uniref:(apollo) hypothetical protein n=1 Tax=Parnassius apollo TaxID=110799 RepID=A0A8S3W3X5_PARAO|nr:unnamed protein product [Parnassius apollo]